MTETVAPATTAKPCQGAGCGQPATLVCPTCAKLGLPRDQARFCSQDCFKRNWAAHKALHVQQLPGQQETYDPFAKLPSHKFRYTGELRAMYPLSATRVVPPSIRRPDYAETGRSLSEEKEKRQNSIAVLKPYEIEKMRHVCKLAREVLDIGAAAIRPGVTTDEIDRVVHEATLARNCYPSPLNYYGFPKSCCTSVNEVICHGIPDSRPLQDGDIVNLDVSIYSADGFHADLNETYLVGTKAWQSRDTVALVDCSRACLEAAIKLVKPGVLYRDVGNTIERIAKQRGFSVVRTYCGHGIHRLFHPSPNIPHYAKNKAIGVMKPGHVFTIEPMINAGTHHDEHWPDNWTAVTRDGKWSAQFEHTLLVTDKGCEVLTKRPGHDVVLEGLVAPDGVEVPDEVREFLAAPAAVQNGGSDQKE